MYSLYGFIVATSRLKVEAEAASSSPWDHPDWAELSRIEVFHQLQGDLVPAQQAR